MQDLQAVQTEFDEANVLVSEGARKYPGMTYEEGVRDALGWILEEHDNAPLTGEEYRD